MMELWRSPDGTKDPQRYSRKRGFCPDIPAFLCHSATFRPLIQIKVRALSKL